MVVFISYMKKEKKERKGKGNKKGKWVMTSQTHKRYFDLVRLALFWVQLLTRFLFLR